MAKVNTRVTLPDGRSGVTVGPVDNKGKQEVWLKPGKSVSVAAKDLK